jgi:hypothetical protein
LSRFAAAAAAAALLSSTHGQRGPGPRRDSSPGSLLNGQGIRSPALEVIGGARGPAGAAGAAHFLRETKM